MGILLGAIADDFTGATDLANTLVRQGMPTVQTIGIPSPDFNLGETNAVVIALKSRTNPAAEAVKESLAGLTWLLDHNARQIFFKYCSTFDSTNVGNIGPVADALMEAIGEPFTIACPAFPENGRTVYKGHLFVGDVLLSDSGMRHHPLTPMTDADLVSVLSRQTRHNVGLVEIKTVEKGSIAILDRFKELQDEGYRYAIVDAINTDNLMKIGSALADLKFITGGSGVALGLPENFRRAGLIPLNRDIPLPRPNGRSAVLAGSCSIATREQIATASRQWPSLYLDPMKFSDPLVIVVSDILAWVDKQPQETPLLIYSSANPETVTQAQKKFGRDEIGLLIERAMGTIAKGLVERGVRQLIVAGGETAGAVVQSLGIKGLRIGPEIDPGVPWTETLDQPNMALVLKSGNFGTPDFFLKSLEMLQ